MLLISEFLREIIPHAVFTNEALTYPPTGQWGYVMGATGQIATTENITSLSKATYPQNNEWVDRARRAKKWQGHKIFDCNGIFEGYIKAKTGKDVNTTAKNNYAMWCSKRSNETPDTNLTKLPQLPGVAVFQGKSAKEITHVGFLVYKYGPNHLDWYVAEDRGVDYGFVIRPLKSANWSYWGLMSKYFEYDVTADNFIINYPDLVPVAPIGKKSSKQDVIWAQDHLNWILNSKLTLDGCWGPMSIAAYLKYTKFQGWKEANVNEIGPNGIKFLALGID